MITTKSKLKEIIIEALREQEGLDAEELTTRQQKVQTATDSGSVMSEEEYSKLLIQVLTTPKVSAQNRKSALVAIFGSKGTQIDSLVLQIIKGNE
mgnify:CR=1 FL=1|tara:strand:+ start:43129 stop:43413 length:285 start_codon:yes stop_codon:yes gene_type:complete